jgi:Winged helix-turn helix
MCESITVSPADRRRLLVLVKDRNAPHKHLWRAEIILLGAGGVGTNAIMRQTGKSKTCVWRWQERFATEGFEGLLRDKARPSRIKPLGDDVAARIYIPLHANLVLMAKRRRGVLLHAHQTAIETGHVPFDLRSASFDQPHPERAQYAAKTLRRP